MGSLSIWLWMIVLVVVIVVFGGRGKLSSIMGDTAKGIREFKNGLKDPDATAGTAAKPLPTEREKDEVRG